jgi:hypothetical protein
MSLQWQSRFYLCLTQRISHLSVPRLILQFRHRFAATKQHGLIEWLRCYIFVYFCLLLRSSFFILLFRPLFYHFAYRSPSPPLSHPTAFSFLVPDFYSFYVNFYRYSVLRIDAPYPLLGGSFMSHLLIRKSRFYICAYLLIIVSLSSACLQNASEPLCFLNLSTSTFVICLSIVLC